MRKQITQAQVDAAVEYFKEKLVARLEQKGYGSFASIHEIAGIMTEEHNEMLNAVQKNHHEELREELVDIAVGAIFGLASIDAEGIDW